MNPIISELDGAYKWRMLSTALDVDGIADPDFILCCMLGC